MLTSPNQPNLYQHIATNNLRFVAIIIIKIMKLTNERTFMAYQRCKLMLGDQMNCGKNKNYLVKAK